MDCDGVRPLAPHEFEGIRRLARASFGLDLKPGKEELVSARLRRIIRSGNFGSFREYQNYVVNDATGTALADMIDALATNHTAFLREASHFEFFRTRVAPDLARRAEPQLWSAACSTGEEVWTIACLWNDLFPNRELRIVGTDISKKALECARRAVYTAERCHDVPAAWLSRYFQPDGRPTSNFRVLPEVRKQVSFRRLNLIECFPWKRQFPVIFCRNVMIYFDREVQEAVVSRLADSLEPGGYLFVGHAESLSRISHPLEYVQPAVYRKPEIREKKWTRSS